MIGKDSGDEDDPNLFPIPHHPFLQLSHFPPPPPSTHSVALTRWLPRPLCPLTLLPYLLPRSIALIPPIISLPRSSFRPSLCQSILSTHTLITTITRNLNYIHAKYITSCYFSCSTDFKIRMELLFIILLLIQNMNFSSFFQCLNRTCFL